MFTTYFAYFIISGIIALGIGILTVMALRLLVLNRMLGFVIGFFGGGILGFLICVMILGFIMGGDPFIVYGIGLIENTLMAVLIGSFTGGGIGGIVGANINRRKRKRRQTRQNLI